jgi:hypothetical protein
MPGSVRLSRNQRPMSNIRRARDLRLASLPSFLLSSVYAILAARSAGSGPWSLEPDHHRSWPGGALRRAKKISEAPGSERLSHGV